MTTSPVYSTGADMNQILSAFLHCALDDISIKIRSTQYCPPGWFSCERAAVLSQHLLISLLDGLSARKVQILCYYSK